MFVLAQAAVADEVAALADEASMPIEELMARYRMHGSPGGSPTADAVHGDGGPARSASTGGVSDAKGTANCRAQM